MKNLLSLFLLSFSISSLSQTDSIQKIKSKYQFGVIYTNEQGNDRLIEGKLNGNSFGVNWTTRIKSKFRFDVGLQFTKTQTIRENLTLGSSIDPQLGFINSYTLKNDNTFIDIPAKINFFLFQKKRMNIYLIAGMYTSFYLQTKSTWIEYPIEGGSNQEPTKTQKLYNKISASLFSTIGIGFEYMLTQKISLTFQSELRYHFKNPNENYYDIQSRINGNIGIRYNL